MSMSGQSLDKDEVKQIVADGLNEGGYGAEHDALVRLADMVGLEFNNVDGGWYSK
jgi:hypothetical protein